MLGVVIGGPVAERLVRRFNLSPLPVRAEDSDVIMGPTDAPVTTVPLIGTLSAALVAVLVGQWLRGLLASLCAGHRAGLPAVPAGRAGGSQRGRAGRAQAARRGIGLIGSVCLSLFLARTMMALDLGAVFRMAGPLLIILVAQVVLAALRASLVTFRVVERDYESSCDSSSVSRSAATAIANMQALARRHGPAPQAFLIVPIVGAFFIDIINAVVLKPFLLLDMTGFG